LIPIVFVFVLIVYSIYTHAQLALQHFCFFVVFCALPLHCAYFSTLFSRLCFILFSFLTILTFHSLSSRFSLFPHLCTELHILRIHTCVASARYLRGSARICAGSARGLRGSALHLRGICAVSARLCAGLH
jgi:hypothetical protein